MHSAMYSVTRNTLWFKVYETGRRAHFNVKLHYLFFSSDVQGKQQYFCFIFFLRWEPRRIFYLFYFFFLRRGKKEPCQSPSTKQYTECGLRIPNKGRWAHYNIKLLHSLGSTSLYIDPVNFLAHLCICTVGSYVCIRMPVCLSVRPSVRISSHWIKKSYLFCAHLCLCISYCLSICPFMTLSKFPRCQIRIQRQVKLLHLYLQHVQWSQKTFSIWR